MVKTFKLPQSLEEWCNCPMMEILPLLLDMEARNGEHQITPSNFLREMQLSTEQRYEQLIRPIRRAPGFTEGSKTFKVIPDIIVFQNYNLGLTYSVQLTLMNINEISRPLRIYMEPTTLFSIRHSSESIATKLAPGLKYMLEVRFSPEYMKDYKHKITFYTSDETFEVPIVAIGPRPLLDLPDCIVVPKTALNIPTERTILVRNIGQVVASFIFETTEGFSLAKARDSLKPNDLFKLTVHFRPTSLGLFLGELKITYETGEMLYVKLEGLCEEADVHIDNEQTCFGDTYLGLSQERVVTLRNDSEYIVDYQWAKHECVDCEAEIRRKIKEKFEDMMEYELRRDNILQYYDIVDSEMNREIYEHILEEQKKECDKFKGPTYSNENFKISPISGQLWPNTQVNFSIIYVPSTVETHKSLAYLDVTGRTKRYHLDLFGTCVGPKIAINLEELDAQNIYIGSVHRYEVAFKNIGPIPGNVRYVQKKTEYGGDFKCSDDCFTVNPNEIFSIYIEFTSLTRGRFVERIIFEIVGSGQILSFMMSGNIVCPLLNFNLTNFDFGDMSVGESKTLHLKLENKSQVGIEYGVKIINAQCAISTAASGEEESLEEESLGEGDNLEFSCSATSGTVLPYTKVPFFVEVTPTEAIAKTSELAIFMWGARQTSRAVFLKYSAHVPLIECTTPLISLKSMFITQIYYRNIQLENKSDYMGHMIFKTMSDEDALNIILEKNDTYIEPWESYELRVGVRTDTIGDMHAKLIGMFTGATDYFTICDFVVMSRGPCIDFDLTDTNIGKVKTLSPIEKTFVVSNDSPISATVSVVINGPYISAFHPVIELEAEQTFETSLRVYGTSSGRFRTTVKLEIEGTEPDSVVISGEFVGGSISTSPRLDPCYYIGSISTLSNFMQEVKFLNEGKVAHSITFKEYETEVFPTSVSITDNGRPFFVISEHQFVINAGREFSLFFDCFSKFPCKVTTRFVCNAKKHSRKNLITKKIFDFKLSASFEVPHVTLSKQYMEFRIDIGTNGTLAVMDDDIELMNQSNVPLHMEITIDEPFYFVVNDKICNRQDVRLEPTEHLTLLVKFCPELLERRIQLKKGLMKIQYVYHPAVDKLQLFGMVNYPNVAFEPSYLDFECIPTGHPAYKLVTLRNLSPLQVEYDFEISEGNFIVTPIQFTPKEIPEETHASSYSSIIEAEQTSIEDEVGHEEAFEEVAKQEETQKGPTSQSLDHLPVAVISTGNLDDGSYENREFDDRSQYSMLLESQDCLEIARRSLHDEQISGELRTLLHPLVDEFKDDVEIIDEEIYKIVKNSDGPIKSDKQIIDLVPRCGILAPYESHILSISLHMPPRSEISATVVCTVAGGASTELDIFAKSGDILYYLKSDVIDFGIVAFNQIAETSFPIENIGYTKFYYSIKYANSTSPFIAEPGWMDISPADGTVIEEISIDIEVKYFPGFPGYFETTASLELAFFDPIILTIKGCAVLPQYSFDFPRSFNTQQNELAYKAIGDITYSCHSNCTEAYTMQRESDYNDWEFVRYKRHYPSVNDIAMAIERKIIQTHFKKNLNLVTFKYDNPTAIIPDLALPPYIIDLGYVIMGSVTDIMIKPIPYSTPAIKLFWVRVPRKCFENGFSMVFQKGQPGPFLVFKPTPKMFPEPNTEIIGHISCIITATMKIDFEVKAIVTVPSLVFKHNSIDFGRVQCGFCLRKSVFLHNDGAVTCFYKCLIQSSSERPSNIFYTKARDGVVDAGQHAKIDIYFQPQAQAKYEWRLVVMIEANKQPLKILLRGFGFLPELTIIDEKIYFEPAIPYSIKNVKYFKIINMSQFPVEICFTGVDKELEREAAIIRTWLNYYNVKKIFIPPRQVGSPLPQIMIDLHSNLENSLREILKRKIRHEYYNMMKKYTSDDRSQSDQLMGATNTSLENLDIPDPLEDKSYNDIQELFLENLDELKVGNNSDLSVLHKGSIFEIEFTEETLVETRKSTEMREGVLIIFHGSPLTDFIFAANRAARVLNINVLSVDQLLYEALVSNDSLAANKVNQIIQQTFEDIASETDLFVPTDFDLYDILKARVALIASGKSKHVTVKKSTEKKKKKGKDSSKTSKSNKSSKKSDKSTDKKKKENKSDTLLKIPLELLYELLQDSLSNYPAGLIVESLNSVFITKTKLALIGLLKGVGNIRCIQGIYFAVSSEDYNAKCHNEALKAAKSNQYIFEITGILERILTLGPEEFDNITPYEKNIYKTVYLQQRKEETSRRLAQREKRLERKSKKNEKKTASKLVVNKDAKDGKDTKEGRMSSKASTRAKKSDLKKSSKQSSEEEEMLQQLMNAEIEAWEMSHILEYWNRALRDLTVPLPAKMPKPKPPKEKKVKGKKSKDSKSSKDSKKTKDTKSASSKSTKSTNSRKTKKASKHDKRELNESQMQVVPEEPPEPKKINIKILTEEEMEQRVNVSIPMWYINNAYQESKIPYCNIVSLYLSEDETVTEALYLAYLETLSDHQEREQLYTVLTETTKCDRYKHASSEFVLYDCDVIPDSAEPSKQTSLSEMEHSFKPVQIKKPASGGSLRKSTASLIGTKKKRKSKSSMLRPNTHSKSLVPRRIMQPDDVLIYEANFFPESCGVFGHYYHIEIVTLPIPFKVYLEGKADIPRIFMDPNMIFSKLLPRKEGHDLSIAYFEKEEMYHMGAIAAQPADSRIECLVVEDKLHLVNDSYIPCDIFLDFLDITNDFSLSDNKALILSNNSEFLTIRGHPVQTGNIHTNMIITTHNNPRVNCIKISSIGTNFAIDITPHNVFFERVLLNHAVLIEVELKNLSLIGANWDFDFSHVADIYNVSVTSGYIKPLGTNTIKFTYQSPEYKVVEVSEVQIKFYDKFRHCEEPILIETIKLSAEVVEVAVDYETDVQLGDIKIGQLFTYIYTFKNKSKFELKYCFYPLQDDKDSSEILKIKECTSIDPTEGLIKPHDITKLTIGLKTHVPIEFKGVPIFKCVIIDPLIQREVLHFILKFSGKVFSSIYKLCPFDEVIFSPQLVDTEVKKDIVLHNLGRYSFTYAALNVLAITDKKKGKKGKSKSKSSKGSSAKSKKSKSIKSSKASKSTKSKSSKSKKGKKSASNVTKKVKATVLKQGIFSVTPSTGVVQPHTETYIQIICKPKKVGTYSEKVLFFISGVIGKYSSGHPLSLQGYATLPEVDFTNLVDIFKEHMILNTFEDALCHTQALSNCVFVLVDKQFYFKYTCLHLQKEARIKIKNVGELGAHVHATITGNTAVFRVKPEKILIEPYNYGTFYVIFQPTALEKYEATLNLSVEMASSKLSIGVHGEGYLPIIQIIDPPLSVEMNAYEIDYKLVLLDTTAQKNLILHNPGQLVAKVVIGVVGDDYNYITLEPECCMSLEANCDKEVLQEFKHNTLVDIKSLDSVRLKILFAPMMENKIDCHIKIFVTNNPYEIFKIHITGQGYKEDVIIEQLGSFIAPENAGLHYTPLASSTESNTNLYTLLTYSLDFGYKIINRLNKKIFRIRNISTQDTYKFIFTPTNYLNFIPAVGHLQPSACKDIIATFFSKDPISIEDDLVICRLVKIRYVDKVLEQLSWDERQHCTIWMPITEHSGSTLIEEEVIENTDECSINTKVDQIKDEPEHVEMPDSARVLRLILKVIVDYCYYTLEQTEITFPVTTMFQTSRMDFTVTNPSRVPVEIDWVLHIGNNPIKSNCNASLSDKYSFIEPDRFKNRPQTCYIGRRHQELTGNEKFLSLDTRPKSCQSVSSIFSSSFSSGITSMHSYSDSDPIPLSIVPTSASIPPNSRFTFQFIFAPFTPLDYMFNAQSDIPNLQPNFNRLQVQVHASGVLPLYHFKIEQSDYLTRRGTRENCEIAPEEGTKVLEFEAIGFGIPVTNKFSIINPTGEAFNYRWEKPIKERNVSLFHCQTPEGSVLKSRAADAVFTFIAQKSGIFEMFYYFLIEKYNLRIMFLLVGHAREPCVFFPDNGKVLKPTVMGIDVHDVAIIKNVEDLSLSYKVNHSSLYHEGRIHKIGIEPLKGLLQPKSETSINLTFHPTRVGHFTFNIEFIVDRLEKPMVLTVSATCFNAEPTLKFIKEYSTHDLSIDTENILQMPVLVQRHPELCKFLIGNTGLIGFYYKWDTADQFLDDFVTWDVFPREGYVKCGTDVENIISLKAIKVLNKKNLHLLLKISYGPTIPITLVCSTCKTKIKFSETSHDFGACLAQKHNTLNNEWTVEVSNNDNINYIVQFGSMTHNHLSLIKRETVLSPKQTIKIQIYFHPKETIKYNTIVNIFINDKPHPITIMGEGVSMEVLLLDIKDKFLDFGAIPLGKYSRKRVNIVNKTKCVVSIYFDLHNRLPIFFKTTRHLEPDFEHAEAKPSDIVIKKKKEKKGKKKGKGKKGSQKGSKKSKSTKSSKSSKKSKSTKSKSSKSSKAGKKGKKGKEKKKKKVAKQETPQEPEETPEEKQRRFINAAVRIRPLKWVKLYSENSIEYTITYMPTERMPVFQEQVFCQVEDTVIPLCVIKASCVAPQYSLYKSKIAFGTVILGSSNKYFTKLINSGDIGGKFKWSWKTGKNDSFRISPVEGYSSPGTCTTFEVIFDPPWVQCNCNSCAKLTIENYKTTFDLDLSGTCINLPNPTDTLKFRGPVRETYSKKFTVKNSTPERWVVKPSVTGSFFHADDLIVIEPKSSYTGEVLYKPLTMTQGNKFHEGKLFLPLPEGQGILYDLVGESLRPKTTQVVEKTIPSKSYNIIKLDINNWLKVTQQFAVVNQIDQPEGAKKVLYKLTGNTIIDVPPLREKTYKWIIYTLNEGKLNFKVKFRNELSTEYICYELKLNVVKCQVLDKFVLNACARQVADYKLKLENPLGEETVYKLSSPCPDLHFVKEATVPPYTEIEVLVEYKPLYPASEFTTVFEAVSPKLGTFPYSFVLSANNAEPENTITLKSALGQKTLKNSYIYNPSDSVTEFTAKLENSEFTVEKHVVVQPKEKGVIEIGFEPSDLGGVHSRLSLSSPILGVYILPLYGIGVMPKAQGPFLVKDNFQTNIPFKNPFTFPMSFVYTVSNEDFQLKIRSEFLKPRSTTRINISFLKSKDKVETVDNLHTMSTGKLIISCSDEGYTDIEWVMYLHSDPKLN